MDQNAEMSNEPGELVLVEPLPTLAKPRTPFSGPQMLVLYGVGNGNNITKAALLAGVHRTTVHAWRQENPDFEAAYQEWKRQAKENARAGIVSMSDLALEVVDKKLRAGDVKTALVVLKSIGALDREKVASTTADEISDERMLEAEQKRIRRDERRQKLLDRQLKNAYARQQLQDAVDGVMADPTSRPNALPSVELGQFSEEQLEQLKEIMWQQPPEKAEDNEPNTEDDKPAVE